MNVPAYTPSVSRTHYLTESEGDTFSHAVGLALTATARVANIDPQSLFQSRDWSPVQSRQLLKDLQGALQNPLQHQDVSGVSGCDFGFK